MYLRRNLHRYNMRRGFLGFIVAPLLVALSSTASAAESRSMRFQHISRDQGLSQSFVYSIVQDHQGFMWFGTQDGLNRYDGFEFKVFVHDPVEPSSISDQSVRTMLRDRSGTLWVGTDAGGLSRYDNASETFTNYLHDPANPDSIADNRVRVIYEDSAGALWVGTDGSGLDRFDHETGTFEHFTHDPADPASLAGASIWGIVENNKGELFVATDGGLGRLDPESSSFTNYRHDPGNASSVPENQLRVLFIDADGSLWVGTQTKGLSRLSFDTGSFEHFSHDPEDPFSISANRINSIFQDDAGVLWIGTVAGLNAWNPVSRSFERYTNNASDRYSLAHDNVASIYQDRGGVLWVGTYNGVNSWNQASGTIAHYRNDAKNPTSLNENTIVSFAEDSDGSVWVASYGGGLNLLDRDNDDFRHFRHQPDDETSLSSDLVMSLLVDAQGVLWAGTRASGLNRYDSSTNTFARFRHDPNDATSISADGVTFVFEDSRNTLWVGTFGGGLNHFDRESQTFTRYQHDADDPDSLSNDRVLGMFEDSTGGLWIGTYGGGLNQLDPATGDVTAYRADPERFDGLSGDEIYVITEDAAGDFWIGVEGRGLHRWRRSDREASVETFQRFTTHDGLPSATIIGAVWDQFGHLWLSTGRGLSRLDTETLQFTNFDTSHGLQGDEFNVGAAFGASDGRIYFGGVNGFNAFYPHLMNGNGRPPQVAITQFLSLNDPQHLSESSKRDGVVRLKHNENVLGFEFATLDFAAPEKNQYMYQLEGVDRAWVKAGTKRSVTYTNLPAGDYVFRVKGSNNNGEWSEQSANFEFVMLPAPWRTWWAYMFYLLLLTALIIAAFKTQKRIVQQASALKHAEELAIVQARLTDAQRIARIGNWEWNTQTNELWWSDEIYNLFQIPRESTELSYETFLDCVHPNDRALVDDAVMLALSDQQPYSIDHRIMRRDGTVRIVHERAETTYDDDGVPLAMTGTVHDITERKRAEDDIRHRAEFQSLLAQLSAGLIQGQPSDIDRQVCEGLKSIGARFRLDAISIWWLDRSGGSVQTTQRWVRNPREYPDFQLDRQQVPWIVSELYAWRTIVMNNIEALPAAAATDEKTIRERGVKSLLIFPLLVDDSLKGACSYSLLQEERDWSDDTVAELQLVAENLAGAIARARAMLKVEQLKNELQKENYYLREKVKLAHSYDEIVGQDAGLRQCLMAVEKVAPTDVPVLVLGETGTGKELIARAIHKLSTRSDKPMVSVNCPALPANLIESELFGHEKGAFTGADTRRHGRFELAHTGTLFLDEIGELPLDLQGKLLRVLQTGEFQRIGGTETLFSDVRLIAATNRKLEQSVERGEFRADLYYRICSFPITLPALRDRKGDIPLLAEHFVHKHSGRLGKKIDAISASMITALGQYAWPGNIRELESTVERALISAENNSVLELPVKLGSHAGAANTSGQVQIVRTDLSTVERTHILGVLEETNWKISGADGAAAILGLPSSTLRSKMKRHGIERTSV